MVMATAKAGKREIKLPGFYTCEQAAFKLRMEADTIRRYVHRGLIRAGIVGNQYLIDESELERFRQNRRSVGRPKKPA
jgi:excisionase family DNA binding protein